MNAYRETHTVTFVKPTKRSLTPSVPEGNFASLLASVQDRSITVKGWELFTGTGEDTEWIVRTEGTETAYLYTATITVEMHGAKAPNRYELPGILRKLASKSQQAVYGSWTLATVDGEPYAQLPEDAELSAAIADAIIGYAEVTMPDDFERNFEHLFGLESHVARIKRAVLAGIASGWRNRFHVVLQGAPGCGKSDLCQSLKRSLGEEAVMEYDATATTGAGAIKDLNEREILPRVLIVEEIEKADPQALSFLLGVMDLRGEIRKTTHRQQIQRETKLLVIATVNNEALFDNIAAGALSSRFTNKIHFKRPSRDMLSMILTREIAKIDGDNRWIVPTLDYCADHDITDPRQVIALCLCGMDGWLTGEFAKELSATEKAEDE